MNARYQKIVTQPIGVRIKLVTLELAQRLALLKDEPLAYVLGDSMRRFLARIGARNVVGKIDAFRDSRAWSDDATTRDALVSEEEMDIIREFCKTAKYLIEDFIGAAVKDRYDTYMRRVDRRRRSQRVDGAALEEPDDDE
jgi:hypothetical protein